jgi:hypothetical protein
MNSPIISQSVKRYGPSNKSIHHFEYQKQSGWIQRTEKSSKTSILVYCESYREIKKVLKMDLYLLFDQYVPQNKVKFIK